MKALYEKEYEVLRKMGENPHTYDAKKVKDLEIAIAEILKYENHDNFRLFGCEVGIGKGALACQLAQKYQMIGFETCSFLLHDLLIANIKIIQEDFLKYTSGLSGFGQRVNFWVLDNLEIKKSEVARIEKLFCDLSEKRALIFFTGSDTSLLNLKSMKQFQLRPELIDNVVAHDFDKADYDFIKNNFSVFQEGFNSFEEEEDESLSFEDQLEEGESIIISKNNIMSVSKKKDLALFFEALGLKYSHHSDKSLKKMKDYLIDAIDSEFGK